MEKEDNKNQLYGRIVKVSHTLFSIFLAVFFIYAGIKKFIPKPPSSQPPNHAEYIKAFEENKFESPVTFKMAIKALRSSGFLDMVGVLQILSGLLIIIPPTRLIGLLMLLPITVNVFCFHFFMDNRPDENIETGFFLGLNILLCLFYLGNLKLLVVRNNRLSTPQI